MGVVFASPACYSQLLQIFSGISNPIAPVTFFLIFCVMYYNIYFGMGIAALLYSNVQDTVFNFVKIFFFPQAIAKTLSLL